MAAECSGPSWACRQLLVCWYERQAANTRQVFISNVYWLQTYEANVHQQCLLAEDIQGKCSSTMFAVTQTRIVILYSSPITPLVPRQLVVGSVLLHKDFSISAPVAISREESLMQSPPLRKNLSSSLPPQGRISQQHMNSTVMILLFLCVSICGCVYMYVRLYVGNIF